MQDAGNFRDFGGIRWRFVRVSPLTMLVAVAAIVGALTTPLREERDR